MVQTHQFTADDVDMLARTIWGEARGESYEGQVGVANVVVNRFLTAQEIPGLRAQFGRSLQGTMQAGDGIQFNCWKPSDANYTQVLNVTNNDPDFVQARQIAYGVLTGQISDNTKGSDHYYNPSDAKPDWGNDGVQNGYIGNHKFSKHYNVELERDFSSSIDMGADPIPGMEIYPTDIGDINALVDAQAMIMASEGLLFPATEIAVAPLLHATPDSGLHFALADISKSAVPKDSATIDSGINAHDFLLQTASIQSVETLPDASLVAAGIETKLTPDLADMKDTIDVDGEWAGIETASAIDDTGEDISWDNIAELTTAEAFQLNHIEMTLDRGDTIAKVAMEQGVARADIAAYVEEFEELNEGVDADRVRAGATYKMPVFQKPADPSQVPAGLQDGKLATVFNPVGADSINIPSQTQEIIVKKGQTLTELADHFFPGNNDREDYLKGLEIARENGIDPDRLQIGQKLAISGMTPAAP